MRHRPRSLVAIIALAASQLPSCDDIIGQRVEDPGPPVLVRILIQDDAPSGGRGSATDLLDKAPPIACSATQPCPVGDQYSHPPCNDTTQLCPDPLSPRETPAAIGIPGNQVRFVFNKQLDPALEKLTFNAMTGMIAGYELVDPSIVGVFDDAGAELPAAQKYWDPIGSPTTTSNLFMSPFGPALVVKPKVPFHPVRDYSVRIKADQIRDGKGQLLQRDGNGDPVAMIYPFRTEGLHQWGGNTLDLYDAKLNAVVLPGQLFPFEGAIDVKDALLIRATVPFDLSTLKVTVKKLNGQSVNTVSTADLGTDSKLCASGLVNPTSIAVFRSEGLDRRDWDEGDYTVSIDAVASENDKVVFSADPFNKTPYRDVPFRAAKDADVRMQFFADNRLLPSECIGSRPTDMATAFIMDGPAPTDGGKPDMSVPDMSVPDMSVPDMSTPSDGSDDGNGGG